jgi:hypothetical protein
MGKKKNDKVVTGLDVAKTLRALKPTGNVEFDESLINLNEHIEAVSAIQLRLKEHREAIQRFHLTRSELLNAILPLAKVRKGFVAVLPVGVRCMCVS